jgi:uncharacterized protein DUF5670
VAKCLAGDEDLSMWNAMFAMFLLLWLFGLLEGHEFGGFVHLLLIGAIIALVMQLVSGRQRV